jgi:hypothetical protein
LKELPEGFILWEHVKYKVDRSVDEKKQKGKHAAGPYERQDAYLYGHPEGRRKRYRSPADYFPHILWLATDKENDRRNCSCKICSPDGEEDSQAGPMKVETKRDNKIPQSLPPAAKNVQSTSKLISQSALPGVTQSAEQKLDAEANGKYLYRPGELVWFERDRIQGLAIIQKRQVLNNKPRYLIQPLSPPGLHPPSEIRDREDTLRPYLAWSLPEPPNLPGSSNMTFEQVPWDKLVRPGENKYIPDGSIFAAKEIDRSYSLFDRVEVPQAAPGEVQFSGMFLGAEKIWVGEPVRLRVPSNEPMVLIVQKLIERTTPTSQSSVTFVGDVYKFVEMPTPYRNRSEWPTPNLPPRMVADLRYRNEVAEIARKGVWLEWRLVEPGAKKGLADIKGRWYASKTMIPILSSNTPQDFQRYQTDLNTGLTIDVGTCMNGTADASMGIRSRKKNRRDTLGRAVAPDFKISRGLDGPPADNVFPDAQQTQGNFAPGQQASVDQYMSGF